MPQQAFGASQTPPSPTRPDTLYSPELIGSRMETRRAQLLEASAALGGSLPEHLRQYALSAQKVLHDLECRVAIVGQVKAGKSSFINSFARRPLLLPTSVNPWTTAVTHVHFRRAGHAVEPSSTVTFFDASEWERLVASDGPIRELTARYIPEFDVEQLRQHVDALRRRAEMRLGPQLRDLLGTSHSFPNTEPSTLSEYICCGQLGGDDPSANRVGLYSDIVKRADIHTGEQTFGFPAVIIDTPGVNDPFMVRDEITRRSLVDADIHIVLLTARQAMSRSDIALLKLLEGLNKDRVVIFINRIDELANVGDDSSQIVEQVRTRLQREWRHNDIAVIAGSALWAHKACIGETIDFSKNTGRKLLTYATHLGLQATVGVPEQFSTEMHASALMWQCSGIPKLNKSLADLMPTSRAAHAMDQLAALLKELAEISKPILTNELSKLDAESKFEFAQVDTMSGELQSLERDIQKNERLLGIVQSVQLDAEVRTQQIVEDQRGIVCNDLIDVVEQFSRSECERLWHAMSGDTASKSWTCQPKELLRLLETTYVTSMQRAWDELAGVETLIASRLERLLGDAAPATIAPEQTFSIRFPERKDFAMLQRPIALDLSESWWQRWWKREQAPEQRLEELDIVIRQVFAGLIGEADRTTEAHLQARRERLLKRLTMLTLNILEDLQQQSIAQRNSMQRIAQDPGGERAAERARWREARRADVCHRMEVVDRLCADLAAEGTIEVNA